MALADYLDTPARPRVRLDEIYDALDPGEREELVSWLADETLASARIARGLTRAMSAKGVALSIGENAVREARKNGWTPQ